MQSGSSQENHVQILKTVFFHFRIVLIQIKPRKKGFFHTYYLCVMLMTCAKVIHTHHFKCVKSTCSVEGLNTCLLIDRDYESNNSQGVSYPYGQNKIKKS